jgi:hypothetical protein
VDGVAYIDMSDVDELVECCLSGLCVPRWGVYSCDIDRSNLMTPADILLVTPADILGVIDLMNGTQLWEPWFGEPLPTRGTTCPPP